MAKGDSIKVVTKTGNVVEVIASQNGRTVTKSVEKDGGFLWLVVQEITRGGTVVTETQVSLADVMSVTRSARE